MSQLGAEWNRLANVLFEDVYTALAAYRCDSNNQFKRRTLIPTVSLGVTYAVVYTYGCDDGRTAPTRCAIIAAGLDGRSSQHRACKTPPAGARSAYSTLAQFIAVCRSVNTSYTGEHLLPMPALVYTT